MRRCGTRWNWCEWGMRYCDAQGSAETVDTGQAGEPSEDR